MHLYSLLVPLPVLLGQDSSYPRFGTTWKKMKWHFTLQIYLRLYNTCFVAHLSSTNYILHHTLVDDVPCLYQQNIAINNQSWHILVQYVTNDKFPWCGFRMKLGRAATFLFFHKPAGNFNEELILWYSVKYLNKGYKSTTELYIKWACYFWLHIFVLCL